MQKCNFHQIARQKTLLFMFLLFVAVLSLKAQRKIPTGYFSSPLDIELTTSGAFGEVRPNHMHSGLDLRVNQQEGLPVYAVADGVVSRIKISPVGFGFALYLDHPNGFTSVYGHLKGYNKAIAQYSRSRQYKLKRFEVDLFPANDGDKMYVKKGDVIGYAGNSGSSGGAHLHFELRNTSTERTINPLLFGYPITDNYAPYIDFIRLYPVDGQSYIGSSAIPVKFELKKVGGTYRLANKDTISVWGKIALGVQAFDLDHNSTDRNGWYSMEMKRDGSPFFSMEADSFSFAETRYINSVLDYSDTYDHNTRIINSRKLPGNKLSVPEYYTGDGTLDCSDGAVQKIEVSIKDYFGKEAKLVFYLKSMLPKGLPVLNEKADAGGSRFFAWNKLNDYSSTGLKVSIPAGALYDNINFRVKQKPSSAGLYSAVYTIHDPLVPLQSKFNLSIQADKLPARLRSKALLVRIDRDGKRTSAGGSYADGWVSSSSNIFDSYAITVDTIAPRVENISAKAPKSALRFKVSDNFSGIGEFHGELNGQWALVQWDPKNNLMWYEFDHLVASGENHFVLYLQDDKGNKVNCKVDFTK